MDTVDRKILELIKNKDNDSVRRVIIDELSKYNDITKKLWENIDLTKDDENRIFLIAIRDLIKKKKFTDDLIGITNIENNSKLKLLLKKEDPKVRKLTCNIIGSLKLTNLRNELFEAYNTEKQFFVKPTIALAIGMCAEESDLNRLKKYKDDLKNISERSEISNKHIIELNNALNLAIDKISKHEKHKFYSFGGNTPLILTVMKGMEKVTCNDIKAEYDPKLMNGNILVKTSKLNEILKIRTFYEILYYIKNGIDVDFNQSKIVDLFVNNTIITNLKLWHKSSTPFFFRVHYETDRTNKERTEILKVLSADIQAKSNEFFINSTTSYEIEFRIIEKKKKCKCYYKLFTFEDSRFSYREKDIPASINPVSAAVCFAAVKKYLVKDAIVLDPFCGSGTMLVERNFAKKTKQLHGIDISQNAVNAARTNFTKCNLKVKLTKFDTVKFIPKIQYDEIVSNMPYGLRVGSHSENESLYREFVFKLPEFLKLNGKAFLLTTEIGLLSSIVKKNKYLKLLEEFKIDSGGLFPRLFVIEKVK